MPNDLPKQTNNAGRELAPAFFAAGKNFSKKRKKGLDKSNRVC